MGTCVGEVGVVLSTGLLLLWACQWRFGVSVGDDNLSVGKSVPEFVLGRGRGEKMVEKHCQGFAHLRVLHVFFLCMLCLDSFVCFCNPCCVLFFFLNLFFASFFAFLGGIAFLHVFLHVLLFFAFYMFPLMFHFFALFFTVVLHFLFFPKLCFCTLL